MQLIEKIFADIKAKKSLADFRVAEEIRSGEGKSLLDALILKPSVGGLGVDLMALGRALKKRIGKKNR